MNVLLEIIKFVLKSYPKPEELSKPRLVKIIYLIDWKYAIDNGKQVSNIDWVFNHYGPYVDDIINLIEIENEIFKLESRQNPYGGITHKFELLNKRKTVINLDDNVQDIVEFIIDKTASLSWSNFISLVYSSYPIKNSTKYSHLNLTTFSKAFNARKKQLTRAKKR